MKRRVRAAPVAAPGQEIELKLRVPPARLRALLASPLLRASGAARTVHLAATYYDTPDLLLWRKRIALRVRREGGRWVQALKGGGSVASGVHTRMEFETLLRNAQPDLSVLPRNALTKMLRGGNIASTLVPVLSTDIKRSLRLLVPAPGVLIEVAIDRGEIRSGTRCEKLCELELELKQGPVTALFDLALQLSELQPLELEQHSKAERGYALHAAQFCSPQKASGVRLMRDMKAGDAFRCIAASTLGQIHGNARGVLDSDDPEYLHQMRVGLRRLRSAFDLFREPLADALAEPVVNLRAISAGLGAARDWDVLVTETLARTTGIPDIAKLAAACASVRQAARGEAKKTIKTNTYTITMLTIGRWLVTPQAIADAPWQVPVRQIAVQILSMRHARVIKRGRHLARQSPTQLHRLRIAVKKLRYAVEFFNDLFQVKAMAVQRARLEKLQDILGCINDAVTLESLFMTARQRARQWPAAAADAVMQQHQQQAVQQRKRLTSAWRRYRAAAQPWAKMQGR